MISKKCAECNNKERLQAAVEGFNQRKPLCLFLRTTVVLYSSTSLVLKQIFKLFVLSLLFSMSFVTVLEESQKAEIVKEKLMEAITKNEMGKYYEYVSKVLGIPVNKELMERLTKQNKEKLEKFEADIIDAEKSQGESEVRDAWLKKAEYLSQIGDRDASLKALSYTYDRTVGVGKQIDIIFHQIRIGFFYMNHTLIKEKFQEVHKLIEQGGDWDRKNRLKAYEGYYALAVRDFKKAASLLLDAVCTFTSYELITYETLVRNELRDKVVNSAEIREQLYSQQDLRRYLHSLMMRAKAYQQLLSSYRSLTLRYMGEAFGVSPQFMDKELHYFISSGHLTCKIDRVRGVVETNQVNSRNVQYAALIRDGDVLLNRIQKLSRNRISKLKSTVKLLLVLSGWIYTAAALLFAYSAVAFTIEPMNLASLGTARTVSPEQIDSADSLNPISCAQIDETDFWLCKGPQFMDSRTGMLHRMPQTAKRKPSMLAYSSRPHETDRPIIRLG
ncbi:26S proteasome non-ATPase regulatory subunit 6 [Trichinella pseudospiralis]|uniref:26S proteasome non-ATPase regulatory subunit 6 n=1 Tax=Trichinella pseudospiralis TaxID=6337 RepID=A0A0V1K3S8_TRIPS|nr:26S proteasome non-ATPase regulatory subunit 6 [Trichinella pseudospiralis]